MKPSLLPLLRCPVTGSTLALEGETLGPGGEIVSGSLVSLSGARYPIRQGIPELLTGLDTRVERTAAQFTHEFTRVQPHAEPALKRRQDVTLFMAKTGIDPALYEVAGLDFRLLQDHQTLGYEPDWSWARGKVVVDGGCGDGRFAELVAPHVDTLICLDLGEHIHAARARLHGQANVHFVRCNLLHVPLTEGIADWIYTIGVVHHTPDPHRALAQLGRLLRPGGEMSAWVYPPAYWGNPLKAAIAKGIRRRLLKMPLERQLRFIRRRLLPLGRVQLAVARSPATKLLLAPLFLVNVPRHEDPGEMEATTIDYYLPEYIETYTDEELREMMARAGLMEVRSLPFPTSARGVRGTPSPTS